MYSVVAQKDSRTNVGIAKAAKRDSSSMTAIAVLGIIFLPAMLVAVCGISLLPFIPLPNSFKNSNRSPVIVQHLDVRLLTSFLIAFEIQLRLRFVRFLDILGHHYPTHPSRPRNLGSLDEKGTEVGTRGWIKGRGIDCIPGYPN